MTLRSSKKNRLLDTHTLPITAALLTDHKHIGLGLPSYSEIGVVTFTDIFYGKNSVVDILSSKNNWDLLFLNVGYQKMSDMRILTKVMSQKTKTAVVIVAPIYNKDEERIYKKDGAKAYILECNGLNNHEKPIIPLIEEIYKKNSDKKKETLWETTSHSQIVTLFETLTPCEKKVFKLYLKGMSITEIACKNKKSVKTISAQKQSAMIKLGLKNPMGIFNWLKVIDNSHTAALFSRGNIK